MFTKIAESKWLKIVLFITTFAFVGTGFVALIVYKLSGNITGVAQVNGEEITPQEYFFEVNQLTAQLQSQGQDPAPLKKQIQLQALETVINRELLYQFAKEEGIQATTEEAKKAILNIKAFQTDGKFDPQKYNTFLSNFNISPIVFTKIMVKTLSAQHILDMLRAGFYFTEDEFNMFAVQNLSKVSGKVYLISPEVSVSQEEIKSYYEKNKEKFQKDKEKFVAIYKVPQDNPQKAQELFKALKEGKEVSEKPAFEGKISNLKDFPEKVLKTAKQIDSKNKVEFVKTKDSFFLVVYKKEEGTTQKFDEVKELIKQLLLAEKKNKEIEKLFNQLKDKKLTTDELKKLNPKTEDFKETPIRLLSLTYEVPAEEIYRLSKEKQLSTAIKASKGVVFIKVDQLIPPTKEEIKNFEAFKEILKNQKFNDIAKMFVDKLKKEAEIKINERYFR